ncbi:MFS transporter [Curvivirga aplysinae]|uniref:MFS transporter n=1 Tax=Curvivirga aplysinae TaxID=2529852 RepID=UPI0012BBAC77|nr:MFS transporter [Curvivirga aplysinae]MTI08892.1 MFS transporter [Curvivirga aplysinae]
MLASSRFENRLKLLYALPAFALAFPTIPVFVLLPTFYAETVGLGLSTVGWVMFGLRLFDVVNDPLVGFATDRIPRRFGRRKLPMAIGGLIAGPALIFLFSPDLDGSAFYLAFWGGLLYLGWTIIQIPYLAWSVELYDNYSDRNEINGLREGIGLAGILSVGLILLFLTDFSELDRFQFLAWFTFIIGAFLFLVTLSIVPEAYKSGKLPSLKFPYKNALFLRVLSAWFINGLANGFPAVCLPLYLTYVLQLEDIDKYLLIFMYFLFAIIGIPVWLSIAKHMDKHKVWCCSMLIACASFMFVPFLGTGDILVFGLICAATGFTLGSDLSLPPSIQSDCADWDRYRFRFDRTATLFSNWSMSTKLSLGVAVGIAFPLLEYLGLSLDRSDVQPQTGYMALIVIYAVLPIVLKLLAVGLMWNFPLTRDTHAALNLALEKRI